MTAALKVLNQNFLLLQLADVFTTWFAFGLGMQEANPVLRAFFPVFGPVIGLFVGKFLTVFVLLAYMNGKPEGNWRFVNRLFAGIVVWNLFWISVQSFVA